MQEICRGLRFPEGPIAMPDGSILVVEIERGTLTRVHQDGSIEVVADCGGGPNGAALGPDGRVYICNNGGFAWDYEAPFLRPTTQSPDYRHGSIQVVDPASGAVETLYTDCQGVPLKGPNDIVFDAHGGFYFTDLGKRRDREMDRGAIFYAHADGSAICEIVFPIDTPNGIGLSPDGKTLYVAETLGGRLWSWQIQSPGQLAPAPRPPNPGKLVYKVWGYEKFDSLAVDAEGNIAVATLEAGCITAITPQGRVRALVPVPEFDPMVTNICFGGPELTNAYITSSGLGRLYCAKWHCRGNPLAY
jgi:gluconolactonase